MSKGLVIAAPASGAGKTMLTLGLLRALARKGLSVRSGKSGPDYIDPQFHQAATGAPCLTFDAWAMPPDMLRAHASISPSPFRPDDLAVAKSWPQALSPEGRGQLSGEVISSKPSPPRGEGWGEGATLEPLLIIEGAMGLFDGAPDRDAPMGRGSTADVAASLGLPVILIVDIQRQGQTAAAIVRGLDRLRDDVSISGVILNRAGSARHARMIERALDALGYPVLGAAPRLEDLQTPSRHLGLVQACERADLEPFIERVADLAERHIDLQRLTDLASPLPTLPTMTEAGTAEPLPPPGQRIAIARDAAFAFCYPHVVAGWRDAGAELSFFSPLLDEPPAIDADAVYLPGGYPELHADTLAAAARFGSGMRRAVAAGALIYGECGGFMVLGEGLVDRQGLRHQMLGLLPVETSFAQPKLHLGYRRLEPKPGALWRQALSAHEFHYTRLTHQDKTAETLFTAYDSMGEKMGDIGARRGSVMGSFAHIICPNHK